MSGQLAGELIRDGLCAGCLVPPVVDLLLHPLPHAGDLCPNEDRPEQPSGYRTGDEAGHCHPGDHGSGFLVASSGRPACTVPDLTRPPARLDDCIRTSR